MKLLFSFLAKILGKNLKSTPKSVILDQILEPRPLPMGVKEFHEWSERIISGALVPGGEDDPKAFVDSQKFALAEMIMHLKPTESHVADAQFIHTLRKAAANQIALKIKTELHEAAKVRIKAAEELAAANKAADEASKG